MSPSPPAVATRPLRIALIGNPNTGKSTLFNALAGTYSRVGNFPGVTVEKKIGRTQWNDRAVELIDLPGAYSLAPRSPDEMVSVDVLLGRQDGLDRPDLVICIADASNLERNLYLVTQVLDAGLPVLLVLNMWDVAQAHGVQIDVPRLSERLGVPVVTTSAHARQGLDDVRAAALAILDRSPVAPPSVVQFPAAFQAECAALQAKFAGWGMPALPLYLAERLLLDVGGYVEARLAGAHTPELQAHLAATRARLKEAGCPIPAVEARVRYAAIRTLLDGVQTRPAVRPVTATDRVDRWLTHWFSGLAVFLVTMFVVFQAIYRWAEPLMGLCEAGQGIATDFVSGILPPGALRSLLTDGVIAGVGGVLIFLPQIALLFLFIALLEDCGYLARAAFLMDKLMTKVGLSGKSFVPLMSSFACAIPGIMATRVIESRRDRLVTLLVAPLMSCSARLPVYLLLIGAFVPDHKYWGGWLELHGLVLFAMMAVGAVVAVPIAWLLKATLLKGEVAPFVMELPTYKWPSAWIVFRRVYDQAKEFVLRAGTLILATSILIWALGYFPVDHTRAEESQRQLASLEEQFEDRLKARGEALTRLDEIDEALQGPRTWWDKLTGEPLTEEARQTLIAEQDELDVQVFELDRKLRSVRLQREQTAALNEDLLARSFLGRLGHAIEPAVRPLGWDWKIGVGVIASFPAREVIIATLGTIYSLSHESEESEHRQETRLQSRLQAETWPTTGEKIYNLPVALSIMVFFALCAQCASTLMVIRRETNSWFWPAFTFAYMTALAYVAAFAVYHAARAVGW